MGIREKMILSIRAQDAASATLGRVGAAATSMSAALQKSSLRAFGLSNVYSTAGRSLTVFGLAATAGAVAAGKMAFDFEHSMAIVRTQTDLTTGQFERMRRAVLGLAKDSSRPLEELTEGLYDIFSTTNANARDAVKALGLFEDAATAGFTEIRTVARPTIGIINAFGLRMSNVSRILDKQFTLVRLGGGTYEELASSLGNVVPSAVAAGQSVDSLFAAMEFLTRQNLSAAESATSVGRAFDLITRTAIRQNLKKMGIEVADASGNFLQMNEILTQLAAKLNGLTDIERKKALEKIFGQGEIRANRFFNLAIPRIQQLNDLFGRTTESTGALARAQKLVEETGRVAFAKLVNHVKAAAISVADFFVPAVKEAVTLVGSWIDRFDDLTPSTKALIGQLVIFGGVISLVLGRVFSFSGTMLQTISILKLSSLTFRDVGVAISRTLIGVGAFAAAAYLIVSNWQTVAGVFTPILDVFKAVYDFVGPQGLLAIGIIFFARTLATVLKSALETAYLRFLYMGDAVRKAVEAIKLLRLSLATEGLLGTLTNIFGKMNPLTLAFIGLGAAVWIFSKRAAEAKEKVAALTEQLLSGEYSAIRMVEIQDRLNAGLSLNNTEMSYAVNNFDALIEDWDLYEEAVRNASTEVWNQIAALKEHGFVLDADIKAVIKHLIAQHRFRDAIMLANEAAERQRRSLELAGGAFDKFRGQVKVTAEELIKAFNKQVRQLRDYHHNWEILEKRNLPGEIAEQLRDMELEGAGVVERLAHINKRKFLEITQDWIKSEKFADKTNETVDKLPGILQQIHDVDFSVTADTAEARARLIELLTLKGELEGQPYIDWGGTTHHPPGHPRRPPRVNDRDGGDGGGGDGRKGHRSGITVNVNRSNATAKEVVDALDWAVRTRGW